MNNQNPSLNAVNCVAAQTLLELAHVRIYASGDQQQQQQGNDSGSIAPPLPPRSPVNLKSSFLAEGRVRIDRLTLASPDGQQSYYLPMIVFEPSPSSTSPNSSLEISIPLIPQLQVTKSSTATFQFHSTGYVMELVDTQMLAQLEELLAYYVCYEVPQYRNRVAICHPDNGQILGFLDDDNNNELVDSNERSSADAGGNGTWKVVQAGQQGVESADKTQVVVLDYQPPTEPTSSTIYPDLGTAEQTSSTTPQAPINAYPEIKPTTQHRIQSLITTSQKISSTLVSTATHVGNAITASSAFLKSRLKSGADDPVVVSASLKQNVNTIKGYTASAKTVSGKALDHFINLSKKLGDFLYRKVHKSNSNSMKEMHYVLSNSLFAVATVMDGLEQSVKIVLGKSGDATVELVAHRYGEDAKSLLLDAQSCVANLVLVYFDIRGIGRKAMLKKVGKHYIASSSVQQAPK